MKTFLTFMSNLTMAMILLTLSYGVAAIAPGCSKTYRPSNLHEHTVTVLENGERDYVWLTTFAHEQIKPGDSLWIDLEAHVVDAEMENSMLCVIED